MSKKCYWVESAATGVWRRIAGATGPKEYCLGYLSAIDSLYPSPQVRVVESDRLDGEAKIIEEGGGRGAPGVASSAPSAPVEGKQSLVQVLVDKGHCVSRSEARRVIGQGRVRVDGKPVLFLDKAVTPGEEVHIGIHIFDVPDRKE